jgi:hypothetical protein
VVRAVVSGVDAWSVYVDSVFKRFTPRMLVVAPHAEMKVAARLRAEYESTVGRYTPQWC